jgi:L-lysine epsilon oxidase-like protein
LVIKPSFSSITGTQGTYQTVKASVEGRFKGTPVYLGELQTDKKGRLLVLGGLGTSASVPAGMPAGDQTQATGHARNSFANNWGWHDDVSDGPVKAVVKVSGQQDQSAKSAWVIVAPPDYAPYTTGITTLFDIATQAANIPAPQTPSFMMDILPILKATAGLRYVSALPIWTDISTDYVALSTKNNAASDKLRLDTRNLLKDIVTQSALHDFQFTLNQTAVLDAWANGNFVGDYTATPAQSTLTPEGLDRASLTQGVGGGFFPGIEAGIRMTSPAMYSSPYRITDKPFVFDGVPQNPHAGFITRTMACPWQSDFYECEMQTATSAWWPAQRPIDVYTDAQAQDQKAWSRPFDSDGNIPGKGQQDLVDKFWMLGLVKNDPAGNSSALYEQERDPSLGNA